VIRDRRNIVILLFFLLGGGLLAMNSASVAVAEYRYGGRAYFLIAQFLRIAVGLGLMIVFSQIDYHRYHRLSKVFLVLSILLLVVLVLPFTKSIAPVIKMVRRWIVWPFTFQPSEFARLALVVWCAATIQKKGTDIRDFRSGVLPIITVLSTVIFLIILEPDLSTAIICFSIVFVMLFLARAKVQHLLLVCGIFFTAFLIFGWFTGYVEERWNALFHTDQGLLEENWHYSQSLIALGSGGWIGRGIGKGMQKFFFLPEPHTDSVFSVIGEEFGFAGTILTLFVFFSIGYYGYRIMKRSTDLLGFLLVGGILSIIFIPMILSVFMSAGLLPGAGVSLPFVSYGGSSMVTLLAGFGILLNVANHSTSRSKRLRRKR
jgi:cell division protein FtsW